MKYTVGKISLMAALQLFSAAALSGFVYWEALLIGSLEEQGLEGGILLGTGGLLLGYMALELVENYVREEAYASLSARAKASLARTFLHQGGSSYASRGREEKVAFFTEKLEAVLSGYFLLGPYLLKQMVLMVISCATLFYISWQCGLAVTGAVLCFGVANRLVSRDLPRRQDILQESRTALVDQVMELHRGYGEIHINQMEALAEKEFDGINRREERAALDYQAGLLSVELMGIGQNMAVYILILVVGGWLAMGGMVGLGVLLSAAELSVQALGAWSMLTRLWGRVKGTQGLRKELEDYLRQPEQPLRQTLPGEGDILLEARQLRFRFEEDTPLLEGVDFSIRPGEKYLIMGDSGQGKSTFLELLTEHRMPREGVLNCYTREIAYLPQEPFLFAGSLRENLTLGVVMEEQALTDMIRSLELDLSLDMPVEDGGGNLSGGQKARIALARALLAEPELLFADELTANLDQHLGEQVERLLLTRYPQMALCCVAHRTYAPEGYTAVLRLAQGGMREVTP